MFIYSGSCTLYVGDEIYMLNSGGLALIPPDMAHMTTYLAGSDHTRYVLYFITYIKCAGTRIYKHQLPSVMFMKMFHFIRWWHSSNIRVEIVINKMVHCRLLGI